MKEIEHERRDWVIVVIILLFGLLCVFLAGGWALRASPSWNLNADIGSNLNPNGDYLTNRPSEPIEAIDSAILTQPVWMDSFLTEGATIPPRIRLTDTAAPLPTSTRIPSTATKPATGTATNALIYLSPTRTATTNPAFTKTFTPRPTSTSTATRTATATRTPTATGTPTNTATSTNTPTATATSTSTNTPTSTATSTNTPRPEADLGITINDNATDYDASASVRYMIVVSNPVGPSGVIGATITSSLSPNLANITWNCTSGASGNGDISATIDISVGSSVTCTVNATVISSPSGNLVSTVNIDPPAGITETAPGNNSATDTDTLIIPDATPPQIGNGPDNNIYVVTSGTILTLQLSSSIVVNGGNDGWDVVYYEWPQASPTTTAGIWMDCVVLQIGDGRNWYTILNWGDNKVDTNASMNMTTIGASAETDNLPVDASLMYNNTGIAIELDNVIPNGTYEYFRIISPLPPLDDGDGTEVDGITILP